MPIARRFETCWPCGSWVVFGDLLSMRMSVKKTCWKWRWIWFYHLTSPTMELGRSSVKWSRSRTGCAALLVWRMLGLMPTNTENCCSSGQLLWLLCNRWGWYSAYKKSSKECRSLWSGETSQNSAERKSCDQTNHQAPGTRYQTRRPRGSTGKCPTLLPIVQLTILVHSSWRKNMGRDQALCSHIYEYGFKSNSSRDRQFAWCWFVSELIQTIHHPT